MSQNLRTFASQTGKESDLTTKQHSLTTRTMLLQPPGSSPSRLKERSIHAKATAENTKAIQPNAKAVHDNAETADENAQAIQPNAQTTDDNAETADENAKATDNNAETADENAKATDDAEKPLPIPAAKEFFDILKIID